MFFRSCKAAKSRVGFVLQLKPQEKWKGATVKNQVLLCGLLLSWPAFAVTGAAQTNWPSFGNDPGAMRYSPLDQINTKNVTQLKVAWKFDTTVKNPPPMPSPFGPPPEARTARAAGDIPIDISYSK